MTGNYFQSRLYSPSSVQNYRTVYCLYRCFSRNGYIVLRSDYRGHGNSEGQGNSYGSNGYTIDVLNAIGSIKKYKDADPNKIGMWGHSMGGHITLRAMVVSRDIKAGVIWAGVVASYPDLLTKWRRAGITPFQRLLLVGAGDRDLSNNMGRLLRIRPFGILSLPIPTWRISQVPYNFIMAQLTTQPLMNFPNFERTNEKSRQGC